MGRGELGCWLEDPYALIAHVGLLAGDNLARGDVNTRSNINA